MLTTAETLIFCYCTQEPIKPDGTTCHVKQWPTPPSEP